MTQGQVMTTITPMAKYRNLATALHAGETYLFVAEIDDRAVHIREPNGRSWCKIDNNPSATPLNATSREVPTNRETGEPRKVCVSCLKSRAQATNPRFKNEASKAFYNSRAWARLRFEAFRAYGRTCMLCGATANLVVDHIRPRSKFPELQLDPDNVQILCNSCNRGKTDINMTDFRQVNLSAQITDVLAGDKAWLQKIRSKNRA